MCKDASAVRPPRASRSACNLALSGCKLSRRSCTKPVRPLLRARGGRARKSQRLLYEQEFPVSLSHDEYESGSRSQLQPEGLSVNTRSGGQTHFRRRALSPPRPLHASLAKQELRGRRSGACQRVANYVRDGQHFPPRSIVVTRREDRHGPSEQIFNDAVWSRRIAQASTA